MDFLHSGSKKRKRKSKGKLQGNCNNFVVSPSVKENSKKVIDKTDAISDAAGDPVKTEVTEEPVNADENTLKKGIHPAFNTGKSLPMNRVQAVMRRNTCRLCGKLFRSGQLLRQHMLVHTDQRKYQCQYCDRTFKQLSHLQQHHRIHTGLFIMLVQTRNKDTLFDKFDKSIHNFLTLKLPNKNCSRRHFNFFTFIF